MAAGPVSVETGALRGLADGLSAVAAAFRSGAEPGGPGVAAAAGDPVLAASLHRLDATTGRARAELDDDLRRMADALRLLADGYEEAERASSGRFGPLGGWFADRLAGG